MTTMSLNQSILFTHMSNYMQQLTESKEAKTGGVGFFSSEEAIVKGYKILYEAMITDEEATYIAIVRRLNEADDKVSVMAGIKGYG